MTKHSIQKLSILGVVVLAASAVTAAILPTKSDKTQVRFEDGDLVPSASNPSGQTCKPGGGECFDTVSGPGAEFFSGDTVYAGADNNTITDDTE